MNDNTPPVFLPVYRRAPIATCPDCSGDLQHEGAFEYWCSACRETYYFTEAVVYEDNERDNDDF